MDLGLNLPPDGQLQLNPSLPDFASLLLLFANRAGAPASAGKDAAPVKSEADAMAQDATAPGLEMLAALAALNPLPPQNSPVQSPPPQKQGALEFVPALDMASAPGLAPEKAAAQSAEAFIASVETSEEATTPGSTAPEFARAEDRGEAPFELPPLPDAAKENGQGIAAFRLAGELPEKSQAPFKIPPQEKTETPLPFQEPDAVPPRDAALIERAVGGEKKTEFQPSKKVLDAAASGDEIAPPKNGENFVPRGLAVADGQVAARVENAAALPSERSGFFTHDNDRHAGGNGAGERSDARAEAALMTQAASTHGVESERPAGPQPAHAWSATIERLAAEISTHARQNQHEISMRLEPPELGHLKIDLSLDGDRLQARVTAEVAEAGNLIQTHLPELRQALQAFNLDLVNVQVDLGGWSGLGGGLPQGARSETDGTNWGDGTGISPPGDREAQESSGAATLTRGAVSVWA